MSMTDAVGVAGGVAGQAGVSANGSASAAPGAQGVASGMSVPSACIWIIGGSLVTLIAIGVVFRRPVNIG